VVIEAKATAEKSGCEINITEDPALAAKGADIVLTDTFVSIGKEDERELRETTFLPKYQVNDGLMRLAKPDSIFMHCLPAKRGQEVATSVLDGKQSVVWLEAENRLYVQKALLCYLVSAQH
jgi:ornithine carbamoyltransferase